MGVRAQKDPASAERREYVRTAATLGKQYRAFFGASVLAVMLLQITIVTDTIIVGQLLGPVPMSGVRVASPIVNILNVLAMLVGVGGSTLVSICIGKRDREAADRAFTLSIAAGIVLGLVYACVVVPFAEVIANMASSDASTIPYTATFLRIVAAASPVYILASAMALLLRADSCIKLSSVVLAAAGVANVAFDLLFMGVLGFGVEGSALATDLGMLSAVLFALLYFRWPHRTLHLRLGKSAPEPASAPAPEPASAPAPAPRMRERVLQTLSAIFKNGATSALRMLFACIALLFLNFVVGSVVGVEGIALLTVCGNIQLLAVAFFSAGGQAAIPMEGVLYGERDFGGLRLLIGYVFRVVLTCVAVIVVVCWLFPAQLVALFVPGGLPGTDALVRLYSLGFIPLAVNYVMTYYYNTIQQRMMSMVLTVCENLLLYLPLIYLLTNAFGLVGAVGSFVAAETLSLLVLVVFAQHLKRKRGVDNMLLIPDIPREVVYEATVPASDVDAAGIAHGVKGALDACGVDALTSMRAALGVEEMVARAARAAQGQGRAALFDVIVSDFPDTVQVSMRDNGAPFDPTHDSAEGAEDAEGAENAEGAEGAENAKGAEGAESAPAPALDPSLDGIAVMRAVVSSVRYNQALGMNQTIIECDKT